MLVFMDETAAAKRDSEMLRTVGEALYGATWPTRIAEELGVTRSHVYSLLKGRRAWTTDMRKLLAAFARTRPAQETRDHVARMNALRDLANEIEERWGL